MVLRFIFVNLQVYAWELPGVAGNACNGLTPTVALQLAAVVYEPNLFFEPLRFMADGAPPLKCEVERKTTMGYGEETLACNNSVRNALYGCRSEDNNCEQKAALVTEFKCGVLSCCRFRATNENGICGRVVVVRDSRRNGPRAMRSCGNGEGSKGQPWVAEAPNGKPIK
eukprot:Gb_09922 [translate_table: standard]